MNYRLALITAVSEGGFTMALAAGDEHQCLSSGSGFVCDAVPLANTEPVVFNETIEGTFDASASGQPARTGTLDFRVFGACEVEGCLELGLRYPCETGSATQGMRMADVELDDEGCAVEGTVSSLVSSNEAVITFSNESDQDLYVYWIDFFGERKLLEVLEPGDAPHREWTFADHPWLIADEMGECRSVHLPTEAAGVVTMQ